ncbi:unnamed protein product [Diabrotica balteata]|uniref:BED-type domain-containing protein n=1 Tax=Diabrotica balteata TaxID=107213 RepID=A0A9N9SYG1_DIABA|nr:unnamed protein product [Diabrotica balteata]
MRPGAKKSVVWEYFDKIEDRQVKCRVCKKILKFFGNTTNLQQHIKRIHPTLLTIPIDEPVTTDLEQTPSVINQEAGPSSASEPLYGSDDVHLPLPKPKRQKQMKLFGALNDDLKDSDIEKIDRALVTMITKDYQPLSIVEDQGFIEYSNLLQPKYKLPNRKKLSYELLPKMYTQEVSRLESLLSATDNVSVTTDIWTSDSNRSYVTVTCHFICEEEFFSKVLSTEEILGHHTGENISNILKEIFCRWNILHKITTIVSDNGPNIKCAIIEFLKKHHHPCVAHTLNLSVNDALKNNTEFQCILNKCKKIVGHFNHSALSCNKLKSVQQQMGFPVLKVKQDVTTRWNSTLLMLERLVTIKDALSITMTKIDKAPEFLDASEWGVIEESLKLLKPLEIMTTALSGEKYPTLSTVIPLLRGLQFSLNRMDTTTDICGNLKQSLLDTIARRLGILEYDKIISKAVFLDPRFKKLAFGNDTNANNAQKWITEELTAIVNENSNAEIQEHQHTSVSDDNKGDLDIWSHFDHKLAKAKSLSTPTSTVTVILRQYLEMPHFERKKNPMEFWKKYKSTFPELYYLAKKYLSIPATSVPSERVFSKSGQLTNLRRNRLSPKNLNQILFLNST